MTLSAFAAVGPAIASPKANVAAVAKETNETRMVFPQFTPWNGRASTYREQTGFAKPQTSATHRPVTKRQFV